MSVFTHPEFDGHEQVIFCHDEAAGLAAIIALHSTTLGPACGGCRMWPYPSPADALTDVLRLARGMSYKNALAGLPLGGGKAVIIGDPRTQKRPELLRAFARHVQALGGRYYTAEDVGTGLADIRLMGEVTRYVFGVSADPSPYTARGVYAGMRAAVQFRLQQTSLAGIKVAVQGVGHVGCELCALLHAAGAELFVADPRPEAVAQAVAAYGAVPVSTDAIHTLDVDIFAPCALGGVINDHTIRDLRAWMIVGSANNQLAEPRHGRQLADLGIVYAPDFVVNAGGMLSAARDILHDYGERELDQRLHGIYDTTLRILEQARAERRPTAEVADELARARIAAAQTQALAAVS